MVFIYNFKVLSCPQKRGVKRGTKGFASSSYTIAHVFGTIKELLSCFKHSKKRLQRLEPKRGSFLCGLQNQKLRSALWSRGTAHMAILPPVATAPVTLADKAQIIYKISFFVSLFHLAAHGRSDSPPVGTAIRRRRGSIGTWTLSFRQISEPILCLWVFVPHWVFGSTIYIKNNPTFFGPKRCNRFFFMFTAPGPFKWT